jgi:hypothetical protein
VLAKVVPMLVGVALGGVVTATAATSAWDGHGRSYTCEGAHSVVECAERVRHRTAYRVHLIPGRVLVSYGDEVVVECARNGHPNRTCRLYEASLPELEPDHAEPSSPR